VFVAQMHYLQTKVLLDKFRLLEMIYGVFWKIRSVTIMLSIFYEF